MVLNKKLKFRLHYAIIKCNKKRTCILKYVKNIFLAINVIEKYILHKYQLIKQSKKKIK